MPNACKKTQASALEFGCEVSLALGVFFVAQQITEGVTGRDEGRTRCPLYFVEARQLGARGTDSEHKAVLLRDPVLCLLVGPN